MIQLGIEEANKDLKEEQQHKIYQEVGHEYLRNRSAPAVNCCVIIHCLEVSRKDQITSGRSASDLSSYN